MKNKSFSVTAEVEVNGKPANGVIIAQGGTLWRLEPVYQGRLR